MQTIQLPAEVAYLLALVPIATLVLTWLGQNSQRRTSSEQLDRQTEIATRQLKGTVVSTNRQRWIDELRADLAELLTLLEYLSSAEYTTEDQSQVIRKDRKDRNDRMLAASTLLMRIRLRLNMTEQDHLDMVGLLQTYASVTKPDNPLKERIVELASKILKEEWEKVKRGD